MKQGKLVVISAPSGAGKTTLVRALLANEPALRLSVSHTTRKRRPNEQDGREYHFTTVPQFEALVKQGEFLEHARVFDNLYGTSRAYVGKQLEAGHDVLLEIDWQGAAQVRRLIPDAVGVFILPPSPEALRKRLVGRGLDSPQVIERRLLGAREEVAHVEEFDYVIINRNFDVAVADLVSIVRAQRLRLAVQLERHRDLINRLK
jgi:guanylate kinase